MLLLALSAACSPSAQPTPPAGPIVSPYVEVTVEDVQVRILTTNPPQAQLIIRGTLPDMCDYQMYGVESRGEGSLHLSLQGIHPVGVMCAQALQSIEYTWVLGQDLPPAERSLRPGIYELTVNTYRTTIRIP
jgi:hypothetical protein